jgi:hypothetical protein
MNFQKILLFIATIILIICLVVIGIALKKTSTAWPPVIPQCPDYWTLEGSGNNIQCTNVHNLGTCPAPDGQKFLTLNPNDSQYQGVSGSCNKYNYATKCGLSWDGITYGVNNPCNT